MLGIWAVASLVGGLAFGHIPIGPWALARRMLLVFVGSVLAVFAAGFAFEFWSISGALVIAGLCIAPALAVMFSIVSASVKFSDTAEAYGWVGTGQLIGAALGSAVAGFLIDGVRAGGRIHRRRRHRAARLPGAGDLPARPPRPPGPRREPAARHRAGADHPELSDARPDAAAVVPGAPRQLGGLGLLDRLAASRRPPAGSGRASPAAGRRAPTRRAPATGRSRPPPGSTARSRMRVAAAPGGNHWPIAPHGSGRNSTGCAAAEIGLANSRNTTGPMATPGTPHERREADDRRADREERRARTRRVEQVVARQHLEPELQDRGSGEAGDDHVEHRARRRGARPRRGRP